MKPKKSERLIIGVVTATRAEYGLLQRLIGLIAQDPDCELRLYVTGTHLSEKYGYTLDEITADGYKPYACIDFLEEGDDSLSICKSSANALIGFAEEFEQSKPDILIVLGDRYELLPIAEAALHSGIPIVHIGGGEISEGAVDELVRHAMTKLSLLHFPSCEEYRQRIIQMGEAPERVFDCGDTGVENAVKLPLLNKSELLEIIKRRSDGSQNIDNLNLDSPFWLVTFHPETLAGPEASLAEQRELLNALDREIAHGKQIIFTGVNADLGGLSLLKQLESWAKDKPQVYLFSSLGVLAYINLMRHCSGVVGNSSSGIIEAPAVGVPTINIGDRQKGRMSAKSVIHVQADSAKISEALQKCQGAEWLSSWENQASLFYKKNASYNILENIKKYFEINNVGLNKSFEDLNCE